MQRRESGPMSRCNPTGTWRDDLYDAAFEYLLGHYFERGHGVVALKVQNLGGRFLPDVEIAVTLEFEPLTALDDKPDGDGLPHPPRDYGTPEPIRGLSSVMRAMSDSPLVDFGSVPDLSRRTWIEDGSVIVRFGVGDLRQHGTDTSDEVYLLLRSRPPDGILRGTWTATVRDIDGLLTGMVDLPVAEEPVALVALLPTDLGAAKRR